MSNTRQYIYNMINNIKLKWTTFEYNFGWPNYIWLFDSWLAKAAIGIPIVGYLILFNDSVAGHLTFEKLTHGSVDWSLVPQHYRLRLVYFGLVFLGIANFLYIARRPYVMKLGTSEWKYISHLLERATLHDFIQLNGAIKNGDANITVHGKYYDAEWDAFLVQSGGKGKVAAFTPNFNQAKLTHESLLKSILIETYARESRKRRFSLCAAIFFGLLGLFLLMIPSLDLFIRVLSVIFSPIIGNNSATIN